jgi:hypothetical protein
VSEVINLMHPSIQCMAVARPGAAVRHMLSVSSKFQNLFHLKSHQVFWSRSAPLRSGWRAGSTIGYMDVYLSPHKLMAVLESWEDMWVVVEWWWARRRRRRLVVACQRASC